MRFEKSAARVRIPPLAWWLFVFGIVGAIAWLTLRSTPPTWVSVSERAAPTPAPEANRPPPEPPPTPLPRAAPGPGNTVRGQPDDSQRLPPLALSTGTLAWEQQLADAAKGRSATEKARAIFQILPSLPAEALATAAEQAIDRLPDRDYIAVAAPAIVDPQTPAQALAILFVDLNERPDPIALPTLLAIAKQPTHPFADAALENLRFILRADYGRDWSRWDAAVSSRN